MFELKQSGEQYHFVLKAKNGEVILSSQMYASKATATKGMESIKTNALTDNLYERLTAKNGKMYFNLKATNGQIIGTSQMYASVSGVSTGIDSVKNNAPDASVKEV